MAFFKALIPGLILTLIVAVTIGSTGSSGGFLDIHGYTIQGQWIYWSWPMFLASTGLCWGILWLLD